MDCFNYLINEKKGGDGFFVSIHISLFNIYITIYKICGNGKIMMGEKKGGRGVGEVDTVPHFVSELLSIFH